MELAMIIFYDNIYDYTSVRWFLLQFWRVYSCYMIEWSATCESKTVSDALYTLQIIIWPSSKHFSYSVLYVVLAMCYTQSAVNINWQIIKLSEISSVSLE